MNSVRSILPSSRRAWARPLCLAAQPKLALFPTLGRSSEQLTATRLSRRNALDMVKRRARQAGVKTAICNHSLRGTGITTYLENGGELEKAAQIANHASTRTTQNRWWLAGSAG
ncbi:MAG: tyrosine-type recombinase/integrase [Hyphomicrobiaceae bacterium]